MSGIFKQLSLWIVILMILLIGVTQFSSKNNSSEKLSYYDITEQVENGNVEDVDITVSED